MITTNCYMLSVYWYSIGVLDAMNGCAVSLFYHSMNGYILINSLIFNWRSEFYELLQAINLLVLNWRSDYYELFWYSIGFLVPTNGYKLSIHWYSIGVLSPTLGYICYQFNGSQMAF